MTSASAVRRSTLDGPAFVTVLLCCTVWGLNQVAAKVALAEVPPLTQASMRSAIAVLLLLAWARWRGVPMWARDGTLKAGALSGLLFALEFACIFIGLQFTAASRMAVFLYLSPFVVALGMPFISRHERLRAVQWVGLAIAFSGVALAFAEGFSNATAGPRQWLGDLLGVFAAVLWGSTTLVVRASTLTSAPPEKTLAYQLAGCALLLGAAAPLVGEAWPTTMSALSWSSMAFQTIVVTFASYLAWFWLLRHYPATRIASFVLLTPMAGLCFGVLLLGEAMTLRLLIGAAAVAAGIVLVNRR